MHYVAQYEDDPSEEEAAIKLKHVKVNVKTYKNSEEETKA